MAGTDLAPIEALRQFLENVHPDPATSGSTSKRLAYRLGEACATSDLAIEETFELLEQSAADVLAVLSACGEAVASACAPLVDLLGPDVVVLAGPIFEVPRVLDVVSRELNHGSFVGRLNGVRVHAASLGRDVGLIGAASLVYDRLVTG